MKLIMHQFDYINCVYLKFKWRNRNRIVKNRNEGMHMSDQLDCFFLFKKWLLDCWHMLIMFFLTKPFLYTKFLYTFNLHLKWNQIKFIMKHAFKNIIPYESKTYSKQSRALSCECLHIWTACCHLPRVTSAQLFWVARPIGSALALLQKPRWVQPRASFYPPLLVTTPPR